jgi:hypothetical protein
VQEELPESLLAGQMLKASPTRRPFLEVKRGDCLARFVGDRQQASLRRLNDRLVNGDDIEVDQAAPELERVISRTAKLPGLEQPVGEFFRQVEEEGRNLLHELGEIAAMEALHAHSGAGPRGMIAGDIHERGRLAKNVAPGKVVSGWSRARIVRHKFHRTSRNNVELVARVPVRVDHVVLGEMLDLGQQADGFQLNQPERGTKREEVALDHSSRKARLMQGPPEPCKLPDKQSPFSTARFAGNPLP